MMQVTTQTHIREELHMHHNRNQKINQITESTLVVGIDIAKETHYACAIDDRGRELKQNWKVKQSRQGFETFYADLMALMNHHGKTQVYIGFEPTGHYWMNLGSFLEERDIPYVLVNPMHVKKTKELDDNLQSKNDRKDARLIAKLIPHGYYSEPREKAEVDHELRCGTSHRDRLRKSRAAVLNRIRRWIDIYFPEFTQVYKGMGVQAKAILRLVPLPADVCFIGEDGILQTLKAQQVKALSHKRITRLHQVASHSIGVAAGPEMARKEIHALLDQLDLYDAQIEAITRELIERAKSLPEFDSLVSVPGISETTIAELLAETGSLKQYKHPRQLIKLAGLTLTAQESGKSKGRKKLSKRGRKKLRSLLYKVVLPLIHANPVFKELFDYYKSRKGNALTGKESLVVLCRKLLQILHGISLHETVFDPKKMRMDMPFIPLKPAA
jgi:transposase